MGKIAKAVREDKINKANFVEICLGEGVSVAVASDVEPLLAVVNTAHVMAQNISRRIPTSNQYVDNATR